MSLNAFVFFLDTYLFLEFKFDTLKNSLALVVFGGAMAFGSGVMTAPLHQRYSKTKLLYVCIAVMGLGIVAFVLNPFANVSYIIIVPVTLGFAVMYPTMLSLFSASVGPAEQGWAMGLTVAVYALGTGSITAIGGSLMHIDTRIPFYLAIACAAIAIGLMVVLFRDPNIQRLGVAPKRTA